MKLGLLAAFALPLSALAQASSDPAFPDALEAFKKGDYKTARILFQMLADKNPSDTAVRKYLVMITAQEKGAAGAPINVALEKIVIPKVEFNDVTVREAMAYLAKRVEVLSQGRQHLNIVWMLPSGAEPRVTLSLQNVPVSEILRYIADTSGLLFTYDPLAVKVQPLP